MWIILVPFPSTTSIKKHISIVTCHFCLKKGHISGLSRYTQHIFICEIVNLMYNINKKDLYQSAPFWAGAVHGLCFEWFTGIHYTLWSAGIRLCLVIVRKFLVFRGEAAVGSIQRQAVFWKGYLRSRSWHQRTVRVWYIERIWVIMYRFLGATWDCDPSELVVLVNLAVDLLGQFYGCLFFDG